MKSPERNIEEEFEKGFAEVYEGRKVENKEKRKVRRGKKKSRNWS